MTRILSHSFSTIVVLLAATWGSTLVAGDVVLRAEIADDQPGLAYLSWDTEGGPRVATNLLRQGELATIRVLRDAQWTPITEFSRESIQGAASESACRVTIADDAALRIGLVVADHCLTWTLAMVLADAAGRNLRGRLVGSRGDKTVDFIVEWPIPPADSPSVLELAPIHLPPPAGLSGPQRWVLARRGWFGAIQPSSQWGEQGRPFSAPAGILGNSVISDPASCSLWFYADQAFWTPQLTPEISAAMLVRRSIDWWLDHRTHATGEVVCYWDYLNFLDANAGPLIAAWRECPCLTS